jgi:uncharacterized membrane protein YgcG
MENGVPVFTATRELRPGEGLTIVAMWPKGFITPAAASSLPTPQSASPGYNAVSTPSRNYSSPAEGFLHRDLPHDNSPAVFGILGLALLLGYYYFIWNRVGRDPPGRVVIPEYEMPEKQSAASMRYLMRMGYDNECFGAGILSLAVKGYLLIQQDAGILGFGRTFTLLRQAKPASQNLSDDERRLLEKLFAGGDSLVLEQKNYATVRSSRSAHESSLVGQYKSSFFRINGGWHFLGILLSLLVAALALSLPGAGDFWPQWHLTTPLGWLTIACVLAGFIANGVFGRLLKAPTVAGQAALDHIRGFKMYLEVAEGEDLKRITAPPPKMTPQLYESYLPAALALDVEQRWAEKFARELDINPQTYHPAWYAGSAWNSANIAGFSSQLGSSLSSAISSASTAPGSHSGGGGGGSSGGGGGGGGGGGW